MTKPRAIQCVKCKHAEDPACLAADFESMPREANGQSDAFAIFVECELFEGVE